MNALYEFFRMILLSIACGAISMTIAKSTLFAPVRDKITQLNEKAGEGISCPFCVSHWIASWLTFIYFPRPVTCGIFIIDLMVSIMMMVGMAAFTSRLIFSAYSTTEE